LGMWYGQKCLVGNLKEEDHLKDLGVNVRIILKWISNEWSGKCTGFICLTIGTSDGLLCTR
jgi:hypothetical protein